MTNENMLEFLAVSLMKVSREEKRSIHLDSTYFDADRIEVALYVFPDDSRPKHQNYLFTGHGSFAGALKREEVK